MKLTRRALTVLVVAALSSACSGDSSPTAPSTPPPPVAPAPPTNADVNGNWSFRETATNTSGGDCLTSQFQALVGQSFNGTLRVTQSGATVLAEAISDADGTSCRYSGTVGGSSVVVTGGRFSCTPSFYATQCPNGAQRVFDIQNLALNLTASGGTLTGTAVETWTISTSFSGGQVGTVTINSTFTATKR